MRKQHKQTTTAAAVSKLCVLLCFLFRSLFGAYEDFRTNARAGVLPSPALILVCDSKTQVGCVSVELYIVVHIGQC